MAGNTTTINGQQITINVNDIVPPENFATVDKGNMIGNTYTKEQDEEWRETVEASLQSAVKGIAVPGMPYDPVTNPIPTPYDPVAHPKGLYEKYDVKQAGTFPNFRDANDEDVVVTQTQLDANQVQIWVKNGVAELSLKAMPQATQSIIRFLDSTFPLVAPAPPAPPIQRTHENSFYQLKDGETATSSDVPGVSDKWVQIGGGSDIKFVDFSQGLFFDFEKEMIHNVSSDIEFKAYNVGLKNGVGNYVRLIADGVHSVDLSNFKKMSGSGDYVNTNGTLNCLYFFYDGFDVWVNIWQGVGTSNIEPVIPPPAGAINWNNFVNASLDLSGEILTGTTAGSGATLTPFSNTLNGFELVMGESSDISVLGLHSSNTGAYVWSDTTDMIFGFFRSSGTVQLVKGAGRTLIYTHSSNPNFARIKRVGNDMVFATSSDGISWTNQYTDVGGFSGFNTAFIKNTFVSAGNIKAKTFN